MEDMLHFSVEQRHYQKYSEPSSDIKNLLERSLDTEGISIIHVPPSQESGPSCLSEMAERARWEGIVQGVPMLNQRRCGLCLVYAV